MAVILHKLKRNLTIVLTLLWCLNVTCTAAYSRKEEKLLDSLIDRIMYAIDKPLIRDKYEIYSGISLRQDISPNYRLAKSTNRSAESAFDRMEEFARTHRIDIDLSKLIPISRSMSTGKYDY